MRLCLFTTLLLATPLAAQQPAPTPPPPQPAFAVDSAAVHQVVTNVFTGMRTRDTALMRAQFHPTATMRSAAYNRAAQPMIEEDGVADWLTGVAGAPTAMLLDERLGTPVIHVDGNLSTLWVYYEFWAGDRFSHCGADGFTLGRTAEGWKILFVADSRRRTGCAEDLPPSRIAVQTPRERALRDMVAAERAFAHYADTAHTGPAFVWALRADAITLDSSGVKLMRPLYEARRNTGALLRWAPSWADAAEDGTLGVTTGPWEWRPARDSVVQGRGNFLTIWVTGPERWQVALDIGVGGDSTARIDEPLAEMPAGVVGRAQLEEITQLDRTRIRGTGWLRALQGLAAPEVRVLREGVVRGAGPGALSGAASVRFTSLGGRVATSGDLGATWGTWRDGARKGSYVRIWKRTADGWRVVIDRMGD